MLRKILRKHLQNKQKYAYFIICFSSKDYWCISHIFTVNKRLRASVMHFAYLSNKPGCRGDHARYWSKESKRWNQKLQMILTSTGLVVSTDSHLRDTEPGKSLQLGALFLQYTWTMIVVTKRSRCCGKLPHANQAYVNFWLWWDWSTKKKSLTLFWHFTQKKKEKKKMNLY